jgi:hypothetical protein
MEREEESVCCVSVQVVELSHYMATPLPNLDSVTSHNTSLPITRVPIVRVFGSTPSGQRVRERERDKKRERDDG